MDGKPENPYQRPCRNIAGSCPTSLKQLCCSWLTARWKDMTKAFPASRQLEAAELFQRNETRTRNIPTWPLVRVFGVRMRLVSSRGLRDTGRCFLRLALAESFSENPTAPLDSKDTLRKRQYHLRQIPIVRNAASTTTRVKRL